MPLNFPELQKQNFDLQFSYHADAIIFQEFPEASNEIDQVISGISIPIEELVRGGGGEAQITQRLRRVLNKHGWQKLKFNIEKRVNDKPTQSQSHEVDHVKYFTKGTIALEIEWNNKDPFFDRDLENFNRLHSDGAISAGMIVTRGATFQNGIQKLLLDWANKNAIKSFSDLEKFGISPTRRQRDETMLITERRGLSFSEGWAQFFTSDKFGSATTHWDKLRTRLDRGVGSPCPIVAIGIPLSCVKL